ncbi:TauD/TfdA dioxygenase family protein [Sphingomonas sp.]|uniref:TauD/TfdA dioxygenase family protein n=1 Tax=Sphingomonas sp. TaxID=28214 RepID=UPI003CC64636
MTGETMTGETMTVGGAAWQIEPCGPVLGAEVSGVRAGDPMDVATAAALRHLLNRYKVLFLRDLDLSHAQHLALGRAFGPLEGHPVIAHVPGFPEILDIRGAEGRVEDADGDRRFRALDKWHTDVTFRAEPSFGAVLRARELPPAGGDTLWADAAAAYAGLADDVKRAIEGRTATHDLLFDFGDRIAPERRAEMAAAFPPQHHPIVRTHPDTGEKLLFVNASFTSRLDDFHEGAGAVLLQHLLDQFKVPEYQVRFRWTPGAVAIWDNRATQHYPVADYWPARRRMERVTIAGERPF